MITQAITRWFQKLFAWRPWKQSKQPEYQPVVRTVARGSSLETNSWPAAEGTNSQPGIVPRLSTLEDWSERIVRPQDEAFDYSSQSISIPPAILDTEPDNSSQENLQVAPTTQQRLEFLRYLVQRNIVNEGLEEQE